MGKTMLLTTFAEIGPIDDEAGIIRGVSVITLGLARGHDLIIDQTTLEQVILSAQEYENGVKVKVDHGSGVYSIVGSVRDFRIDGDRVKGDLHLLKTADKRQHILELARELPDTFGLSVSINGMHETKDGKTYARCSRIRSCDIVTDPAANPDGLLAERIEVDTPANSMDAELGNLKEWYDKVEKRFSGLESLMAEVKKAIETPEEDEDEDNKTKDGKEMSAAIKSELAEALASVDAKFDAINETLSKLSTNPDPASGGEGETSSDASDDEPKNFDEAVANFVSEGKKPTEAIKLAAIKYPALRKADLQAKGLQLI
jgi:hypothetical protein